MLIKMERKYVVPYSHSFLRLDNNEDISYITKQPLYLF